MDVAFARRSINPAGAQTLKRGVSPRSMKPVRKKRPKEVKPTWLEQAFTYGLEGLTAYAQANEAAEKARKDQPSSGW